MRDLRKLYFFMFVLCLLISFRNQNGVTKKRLVTVKTRSSSSVDRNSSSIFNHQFALPSMFLSVDDDHIRESPPSHKFLEYDFYRDSCPNSEKIIREIVIDSLKTRPQLAPSLLRLVFHDCFIEGCDASVLLDPAEGIDAEKESPPNETLKGFDVIDLIKSELELACPGTVSCADILVLAAREAVVLSGGPFYPLYTGRRDSNASYGDIAAYELPSPHGDLAETLASFASRGFDEREAVSLLGAHSIGVVHCKFFRNRLYNFNGSNKPDPSLDTKLLNEMRSKCINNHTPDSMAPKAWDDGSPPLSALAPDFDKSASSISSAPEAAAAPASEEPGMDMAYEGPESEFGTSYYRGLLQGKGILYADQQLTAGEETGIWVRAYASDSSLFRRDFALAMMKLSNLGVLTSPMGQVRRVCSKLV